MLVKKNIHEAKTHFSRLIQQALEGNEVIIAKAGQPLVRIVPIVQGNARSPGSGRGQISVRDDFDAPLPDAVLRGFEP